MQLARWFWAEPRGARRFCGRESLCCHDALARELPCLCGRGDHGPAMVDRGEKCVIVARRVLMLCLEMGRRGVLIVGCGKLLSVGFSDRSALAAVEAHVRHSRVVDHRLGVDVGDVHGADIDDSSVVHKDLAVPVPTLVAQTAVAIAIIDAAVEPDARPPIPGTPKVDAVVPGPISGRPQETDSRCQDPRTRHPVVAARSPCPIAWRPDVVGSRYHGLNVDRQWGWREDNAYEDLRPSHRWLH